MKRSVTIIRPVFAFALYLVANAASATYFPAPSVDPIEHQTSAPAPSVESAADPFRASAALSRVARTVAPEVHPGGPASQRLCTLPSPDLSALSFWRRYPSAVARPDLVILPLRFNEVVEDPAAGRCDGALRLKSYYVERGAATSPRS